MRRLAWLGLAAAALGRGCGITPHSFRAINHPAAITRARSVALGDRQPEWKVVPALIARLEDTDPVVRLSAYEELKRRTGQDFGYVPWGPPPERTLAVQQWRAWWEARKAGLARNRQNP